MDTDTTEAPNERTVWTRLLYMLLFAFFLWVARFVLWVVVVVQFFFVVFTGSTNGKLQTFGQSLSTYHYQVIRFLTFNSEVHPYPMNDWPEGPPHDENKYTTL